MNKLSGTQVRNEMKKIHIYLKALKINIKIKGFWSLFVDVIGFTAVFFPILAAKQLQYLTDELQMFAIGEGHLDVAFRYFICMAVIYILQLFVSSITQYFKELDEIKIGTYTKEVILKCKCEARYKYIENYDDFQKKITFTEQFAGSTMAKSINNVTGILQQLSAFVITSIVLWTVNPLIVVCLYITSIPAAVLAYLQQDETFRNRTKWIEEGALAIYYYNVIAGASYVFHAQQEIRHNKLLGYLKKSWKHIVSQYVLKRDRLLYKHVRYNIVADILRSSIYFGILFISVWRIYENPGLGLGEFALVYSLTGQLQQLTYNVFVGIMDLIQNVPYLQEFFELEEIEKEPETHGLQTMISGEIRFNNVTFAYPNTQTDVLKEISVKIHEGEKVAIVGANGSGKSTFISLICGMFEPRTGIVEVGGVNALDARSNVSAVFQDFAHYESTIRDNIVVSDRHRDAGDEEIMQILQEIGAEDIVDGQPNGLNEMLGSFSQKGNNLSGGQWQKLSIARATFRERAKIMILDEPTSALDPIAEAEIYRKFSEIVKNKTTLLISHRLGITTVVDRILVFKEGKIIEDGCHKELMKKNGEYAKMYNAQAQWYQ